MSRKDFELGRAGLHVVFNVVAFVLIAVLRVPDESIDIALKGAGIAVVVAETFMITGYWTSTKSPLHWYGRAYQWFYHYIARYFIRPKEMGKLTAMSSYLLGLVIIRLVLHAPMIDCLYIMTILSWGDPAARIGGVGISGPHLPWKHKKTIAGFLSFTTVSLFMLVMLDLGLVTAGILSMDTELFIAQYFAVLGGALAEAYVPWWDNFFITLASYGTYYAIMG